MNFTTSQYILYTDAIFHLFYSEEAPKWTAYCAYNVYLDTAGVGSRQQHQQQQDPVALNVLLASSSSLLYSYHVSVADLLGQKSSGGSGPKVPPSHLVGVIELPLKVSRRRN